MTFLMGGGIGITPLISMAHRLHALGKKFEMHYSFKSNDKAGFLKDLQNVPWCRQVHLHNSAEGTRAQLEDVFGGYQPGSHLYTCGPDNYMQAVIESAERAGFPDEARHLEYFSVPETPEYVNHDFMLRLLKSGRDVFVPADKTATDALTEAGVMVDIKCSDGLCGVCQCQVKSGQIEHRDFVLSKKQQKTSIILCQSRAAKPDGIVEIDL